MEDHHEESDGLYYQVEAQDDHVDELLDVFQRFHYEGNELPQPTQTLVR